MNYNAITNPSPEQRAEFITWLTQITVAELAHAATDKLKLYKAVEEYLTRARTAQLNDDDIENILGVDEPSIMDLAMLSEEDEEIVIDAFEELISTHNPLN